MSGDAWPVPGYLPPPDGGAPAGLEDLLLDLYAQLSAAGRQAVAAEKAAQERIEAYRQESDKLVALLAAERFELSRLAARIFPELRRHGADDVEKAFALFVRGWDATLLRARIEVHDPTGQPLSDELAEVVEVESAIPEAGITEPLVRETLTPLVLRQGRVVGFGRVVTSVPLAAEAGNEGPPK